MLRLISFFFLILTSTFLFAQREYSTSSPKAIRAYEDATKLYDARQNDKALAELKNAISADSKFIEAYMLKANIYSDLHDHEKAIDYYTQAININPDFFPNNFFSLGREEYLSGKYDDAKTHLEKFITYPKVKGNILWGAKKMIKDADFSKEAVNNPVPFNPQNMGDSINTSDEEYFPSITADGSTLLFTRRLKTISRLEKKSEQEDFYFSKKAKNTWSNAQPLLEINTDGNEGASTLSADGQYLFLTICEELPGIYGAQKTKGSCDIFLSKKIGDKYSTPRNLEGPINSGTWESQPSFSSDGRTLYFVRRMNGPGGIGQSDILVSHIGDNSAWSDPVSVSDSINTSYDESSVFIHPDNQTIYFSSNGHPGMGGTDIFMSRKDSAGNWTKPVNLGYPINTIHDDNSFLVSPDGKTGYFASDREGGKGGLDLYQFPLYEKARPQPVTYMKGKVYDDETKKVLSASFELIDLASGKIIVSSTSNSGNGEFIVTLPTGKNYALNVSKDGYLFYSDNFKLTDQKSANAPFMKDVPLKPIKSGESIVLNNIFFETDKYELKEESKIELGKLVTFLNRNPKINFEVSGHTDSVGTKQYNQTLSEKRAKSVFDYLSGKGIAAARMISKGYGDSKPVSENRTENGRSKNRRTEFMITSVE